MSINRIRDKSSSYAFSFWIYYEKKFSLCEAVVSFTIAAEGLTGRRRIIALEELAKLYEHKLKELEKALKYTKEAQRLLKDTELTEQFQKAEENNF